MKTLAIVTVVLICVLVVASQHLFNWLIRMDFDRTPLPIVGIFGIIISIIILGITIYTATKIF